jgi:hypothetical protein
LRAEHDAAWSNMAEVEHCVRALTSEYEDLKKDFESMHTSHDDVVREKADVEKTMRTKLEQF